MLLDVPTSSVALALQSVVREKNKVYLNSGAASSALTGAQCSPNFIHWTYDTYMLAKSTGGAMVKAGGDSWYFLTADYAFGKQLQSDTTALVTAAGGKVLGAAQYPFPGTTDFSSFLVQAQSSGAKVLGLCNAGGDTVNSIKQAQRVRPEQVDEDRRAADVHHRRARARPGCRAGPEPDGKLLLGPERPHPGVHQPGAAEDAEQLSEHGPCRLLLGARCTT